MNTVVCELLALPGGEVAQGPFAVTIKDELIVDIRSGERPPQPEELGSVEVEHREVESSRVTHTYLLTPGFVDLHTHGVGGGADVIDFWLHPEYTQKVLPSQGTTSFLASVVFPRDHPEKTAAVLSMLSQCMRVTTGVGAILEGVHAEGPIVNDLGAMPPTANDMSLADFEKLLDSIPGLKVMTISPHLEAACGYQRLRALVERGVVPALGHDRIASEDEILGALMCCPRSRMHITHLFNVCSFHHRNPSLVNFGLCHAFPNQPQYSGLHPPTIELVGDLAHVHPMVLSTALHARHFSDVIFVSDSVLEPKAGATVNYLDRKIQVSEDCRTLSLVGENVLAGSCCTLLDTFHSLVRVLGVSIGHAVSMLAENPARIAGLTHIGRVEKGKRADLLMFDQNLDLKQTIIAGKTAYS